MAFYTEGADTVSIRDSVSDCRPANIHPSTFALLLRPAQAGSVQLAIADE